MIIFAIIVTFNSDENRLDNVFRTISAQCSFIVADNSDDESHSSMVSSLVDRYSGHYISMMGNKGIAFAQNKAIASAWSYDADAVLLLDDDSVPADKIVYCLAEASDLLGPDVVVGAIAIDSNGNNVSNSVGIKGEFYTCRDMMSSGTLIRRNIFELVGPFDASMFIDCVDYDWGWRAQRMRIELLLCPSTHIKHRLGEGNVWGVSYSSPIRHYYQYRNIMLMMCRAQTPCGWTVTQIFKLMLKPFIVLLMLPSKFQRLRYIVLGILDFARGYYGPFPEKKS